MNPQQHQQRRHVNNTLINRRTDTAAGKQGKQIAPVSAKRNTMLELPLEAYQKWADKIEEGFRLASIVKYARGNCY